MKFVAAWKMATAARKMPIVESCGVSDEYQSRMSPHSQDKSTVSSPTHNRLDLERNFKLTKIR